MDQTPKSVSQVVRHVSVAGIIQNATRKGIDVPASDTRLDRITCSILRLVNRVEDMLHPLRWFAAHNKGAGDVGIIAIDFAAEVTQQELRLTTRTDTAVSSTSVDDGCVWSRPDDAVKAHPDRTALTDIDLDTPSELCFGHPGFDNLGDVGTCFIHQCTCTSDGIDFLRLFDCFDWFDDAACWNKVDRRWKSANEGVPRIYRQGVRLDR